MPTAAQLAAKASRPRQDPVSCQLCRTKKLKCNREHPCSNCLARGVTCTLGNAVLPAVAAVAPRSVSVAVDSSSIISRLDRIESLLLNRRSSTTAVETLQSPPIVHSPRSNTTVIGQSTTGTTAAAPEHEEELRHDSMRLYGIATREKSALFTEGYEITVRIAPINRIIGRANAPIDSFVGYSTSWEPRRLFWLPPKEQALQLMDDFVLCVDCAHHVLYMEDARRILEEVYQNPVGESQIDPSYLGLLFGAFASVAGHRSCVEVKSGGIFSNKKEAFAICRLWLRHGMDCLGISRRTGSGTLQDVMMCIVLCFLVFNLEGFSVRARSLHTSALTIAKDLGLHKTDSPDGREENAGESHISVEIKRRLWWHVASTDWLLGVSGGPQEGTYFVNPRHMAVNRPRNITDEELKSQGPWLDHPMHVPTEMSYFLLRIQSAELARMTSDAWPYASSDVEGVDYAEIVAIDARFEEVLGNMPVFFRLDDESRRRSQPISAKFPYFVLQKYLIGISLHMRRCKLHQPFLVRGSQDERFHYSREACIRAARAVIHAKQQLDEEKDEIVTRQLPLNLFVVHHVFVATIVLVMDLCHSRNEGGAEEARREEVMAACRSLESTKTSNALANKFLASLTDVLRKHKIYLITPTDTSTTATPARRASTVRAAEDATQDQDPNMQMHASGLKLMNGFTSPVSSSTQPQVEGPGQLQQPQQQPSLEQPAAPVFQLDDMWQDWLNQGVNFEASNWDHLFSELDNPSGLAGFDMNVASMPEMQ